jgi:hypothetical protein
MLTNKGKDLKRKQVWIFGLVDRATQRAHMQVVPNRDASTLLSIIYDHVEEKSIIGYLILGDQYWSPKIRTL